MAKRSPRLLFTEEELETPELQKPIRKAEKAAKKLEKAERRISKKKIVQKTSGRKRSSRIRQTATAFISLSGMRSFPISDL